RKLEAPNPPQSSQDFAAAQRISVLETPQLSPRPGATIRKDQPSATKPAIALSPTLLPTAPAPGLALARARPAPSATCPSRPASPVLCTPAPPASAPPAATSLRASP